MMRKKRVRRKRAFVIYIVFSLIIMNNSLLGQFIPSNADFVLTLHAKNLQKENFRELASGMDFYNGMETEWKRKTGPKFQLIHQAFFEPEVIGLPDYADKYLFIHETGPYVRLAYHCPVADLKKLDDFMEKFTAPIREGGSKGEILSVPNSDFRFVQNKGLTILWSAQSVYVIRNSIKNPQTHRAQTLKMAPEERRNFYKTQKEKLYDTAKTYAYELAQKMASEATEVLKLDSAATDAHFSIWQNQNGKKLFGNANPFQNRKDNPQPGLWKMLLHPFLQGDDTTRQEWYQATFKENHIEILKKRKASKPLFANNKNFTVTDFLSVQNRACEQWTILQFLENSTGGTLPINALPALIKEENTPMLGQQFQIAITKLKEEKRIIEKKEDEKITAEEIKIITPEFFSQTQILNTKKFTSFWKKLSRLDDAEKMEGDFLKLNTGKTHYFLYYQGNTLWLSNQENFNINTANSFPEIPANVYQSNLEQWLDLASKNANRFHRERMLVQKDVFQNIQTNIVTQKEGFVTEKIHIQLKEHPESSLDLLLKMFDALYRQMIHGLNRF